MMVYYYGKRAKSKENCRRLQLNTDDTTKKKEPFQTHVNL